MVYIISYDLNKQGKDYAGVFQAIKDASTGAWWHHLDSTWIIKSTISTPEGVYDKIKSHLDTNDHIFICELKQNYYGWLKKDAWEYLEKHIFS